jgi:hypothetical protein
MCIWLLNPAGENAIKAADEKAGGRLSAPHTWKHARCICPLSPLSSDVHLNLNLNPTGRKNAIKAADGMRQRRHELSPPHTNTLRLAPSPSLTIQMCI